MSSPYFGYKSKILIPFISVSCISVVLLVATLKQYHMQNKANILFDSNYQAAQTVMARTNYFILPSTYAVEKGAYLIENHILELSNKAKLEKYALMSLTGTEYLNAVYIADKNGNFVMSKRIQDGNIQQKNITRSGLNSKELKIIKEEKTGNILSTEVISDSKFDPRERFWYKEASATKKAPFWTDLYLFFTDNKIGISVSNPIKNEKGEIEGVIGADISMEQISSTFNDLKINPESDVLILNNTNRIIASRQELPKSDSKIPPYILDLSDNALIKQAFKAHLKVKKAKVKFVSGSETYISTLVPFPNTFSENWKLLIITPLEGSLTIAFPYGKIALIIIGTLLLYIGIAFRCEYLDKKDKKK